MVTFAGVACIWCGWPGFKRAVGFLLTCVLVIAIYFTETRAIWVGFAAIMITMLMLRTKMRRNALMVCAVLTVGFFAGVLDLRKNTLFQAATDS